MNDRIDEKVHLNSPDSVVGGVDSGCDSMTIARRAIWIAVLCYGFTGAPVLHRDWGS